MTTNETIGRTGLRSRLEKMQEQVLHFEGMLENPDLVFSSQEREFLRKTVNALYDSQNEIYNKLLTKEG